jgi:hypothetical protein
VSSSPATFADLHLHTRCSDGTYTPEELARLARRHHLAIIALTDHDTVEGCAAAAAACHEAAVEFIPGVELTAVLHQDEVHLIGYGIDVSHPRFLQETARFQQARQDRVREMVARLNQLNIPLRAEEVFALANCRSPGRPHVGQTLVARGFCASVDEAFHRLLRKHRPAWVPKPAMPAHEAICLIHEAGGVAVMAHPALNRTDDMIPEAAEAGLDGLECYHTKHTPSSTARYLRLAANLRLLITGGSDCHGWGRSRPVIGGVKLPLGYARELLARLRDRRRAALEAA